MVLSDRRFSQGILRSAVAGLAATLFTTIATTLPALAQTESVLYNFCSLANCADGDTPEGGLIVDAAGNLYGTTMYGGSNPNGGVVFKLTSSGEESIVYSFHNGLPGDGYAQRSVLTMDEEGNFYGTSSMGGANSIHVPRGDGTAFKVSPDGTETILHNFGAFNTDGVEPVGGMVVDAKGNLYGTTYIGGIKTPCTIMEIPRLAPSFASLPRARKRYFTILPMTTPTVATRGDR